MRNEYCCVGGFLLHFSLYFKIITEKYKNARRVRVALKVYVSIQCLGIPSRK